MWDFEGLVDWGHGTKGMYREINYDQFSYAAKVTNFKKAVGSYDDFIENLEKLCSVIFFAYTFLLFLLFFFHDAVFYGNSAHWCHWH